eukprot:12924974-Prorocentrum_lima.AAC.1
MDTFQPKKDTRSVNNLFAAFLRTRVSRYIGEQNRRAPWGEASAAAVLHMQALQRSDREVQAAWIEYRK